MSTRMKGILILVGVLFVGGMFATAIFSEKIYPHEFGVKQVKMGIDKGFKDGYEEPGRIIVMPAAETMHKLPRTLKFIEMLEDNGGGISIPTLNGQKVTSDIVIAYSLFPTSNMKEATDAEELADASAEEVAEAVGVQVVSVEEVATTVEESPEKTQEEILQEQLDQMMEMRDKADTIGYHGGPLELYAEYGRSPEVWASRIRQKAEDACKRALGRLTTDEYYQPIIRETQALLAQLMLNQGWEDEDGTEVGLHAYGVHVHGVLIRAYDFPQNIDDAIEAKVTQVQTKSLREAEEERETWVAEVQKEASEGEASKGVRIAEGQARAREIIAEALQYRRERESEGNLLVKEAQAKVTEAKADVLNMSGGPLYVARELSELPKMIQGGILVNADPMNLNYYLDLVNIEAEVSDPSSSAFSD